LKKKYKTTRKYKCPYCDKKMTREDLITHVEDEHELMIPEDYSAARAVYDSVNGKNYGTCMVCGNKVYEWDPHICRYKNLCGNPKCREAVSNKAKTQNHLDDPEKQKIMLNGRKLSGVYKFADGTEHTYVGTYERKCLEFMDKGLNILGKDVVTPGPVIQYEYNGEQHSWILDILYIPAMLAIDCKDGGNNPNTRPMESYREKQLAKEDAISKHKEYNYLRLTDNDFGQLLSALADIKYGVINNDPEKGIYIHESSAPSGGMVGMKRSYFVVPYMMDNRFDGWDDNEEERRGIAFGSSDLDSVFHFDKKGKIKHETDIKSFLEGKTYKTIFFKNRDLSGLKDLSEASILEALLGFKYTSPVDFMYCEDAYVIEGVGESLKSIRQGLIRKYATLKNQVLLEELIDTKGYVKIMRDQDGFFLITPDDFVLCSDKYLTLDEIPYGLIDLYNDLYERNRGVFK